MASLVLRLTSRAAAVAAVPSAARRAPVLPVVLAKAVVSALPVTLARSPRKVRREGGSGGPFCPQQRPLGTNSVHKEAEKEPSSKSVQVMSSGASGTSGSDDDKRGTDSTSGQASRTSNNSSDDSEEDEEEEDVEEDDEDFEDEDIEPLEEDEQLRKDLGRLQSEPNTFRDTARSHMAVGEYDAAKVAFDAYIADVQSKMTGLALAEPYFERINCHLLNKRPGEAMADLHAVGDLFRGQKSKDYYALKLRYRLFSYQAFLLANDDESAAHALYQTKRSAMYYYGPITHEFFLYLVWLGEKLLELKATDDAISVWKSACDVNNSFKTAAIRARLYYYLSQLTGPGQKGYDSDVYIETLGRALDLFRSIERSTPTSSLMPFYCMVDVLDALSQEPKKFARDMNKAHRDLVRIIRDIKKDLDLSNLEVAELYYRTGEVALKFNMPEEALDVFEELQSLHLGNPDLRRKYAVAISNALKQCNLPDVNALNIVAQ